MMVNQMLPRDTVRRKVGDRRVRPRFDILGDLWGTLETVVRPYVMNVSRGGALLRSHMPLPVQSVLNLEFQENGQSHPVQVRVSHVDSELAADGERSYLIGVQFLSASPALQSVIEQWLAASEAEAAGI